MTDTAARLSTALSDRYRLESELGQGGMATVYLAEDVRHRRKVAIKVLRPELAAVLGVERFLQEIEPTAQLQHPHILTLYDSGQVEQQLFYVMPYVDGESLADRLARERQLSVAEAVRITCEVADALDYAHRHGVVHRDIKPANVLLQDGRALVADFGIARAVRAATTTAAGRPAALLTAGAGMPTAKSATARRQAARRPWPFRAGPRSETLRAVVEGEKLAGPAWKRTARPETTSHRAFSCPSWDRTRTLLIQSQACCQLHQGAAFNCHGAEGARTPDLLGAIQALSQLSYSPATGGET